MGIEMGIEMGMQLQMRGGYTQLERYCNAILRGIYIIGDRYGYRNGYAIANADVMGMLCSPEWALGRSCLWMKPQQTRCVKCDNNGALPCFNLLSAS